MWKKGDQSMYSTSFRSSRRSERRVPFGLTGGSCEPFEGAVEESTMAPVKAGGGTVSGVKSNTGALSRASAMGQSALADFWRVARR